MSDWVGSGKEGTDGKESSRCRMNEYLDHIELMLAGLDCRGWALKSSR